MERDRVIDFATDPLILQVGLEAIASPVRDADTILIPNMSRLGLLPGQFNDLVQLARLKQLFVSCCVGASSVGVILDVRYFDVEDSRLEGVQTAVDSDEFVVVTRLHTVRS